jgi:hypothetical protein
MRNTDNVSPMNRADPRTSRFGSRADSLQHHIRDGSIHATKVQNGERWKVFLQHR